MTLRVALHLALAGLVFSSGGCTQRAARPAPMVPAHWQIRMVVSPAAPRQLDPTQFRVTVTDSLGSPVRGADVKLNLAMPAMDMGRNEVAAQAGAEGIYTAGGRFTMPGKWQVTVQADKGMLHQSQSFPITVE